MTWLLLLAVLAAAVVWVASGYARQQDDGRVPLGGERREDETPGRALNANINPSQHGNERDLWPDRTGPQTRKELGARHAADVTFVGDREEHKQQPHPPAREATKKAIEAAKHEHGPGTNRAAGLAPEDEFGEDRPAARTTAPDGQPTQWHKPDNGVPGDHYRDGHHRSATAPERHSTATDPYAHAPTPGPNHIIPPGGDELPPEVRP